MSRVWRINWIVVAVSLVHSTWAFTLLNHDVRMSLPPRGDLDALGVDHQVAGLIYLAATATAIFSCLYGHLNSRLLGLALCAPQQILLTIGAINGIECIMAGQYVTGEVVHRAQIANDQAMAIACFVTHTASLIDWYWFSRIER